MQRFSVDSTSEQQVRHLVHQLITEEWLDYQVLNEYGEDITADFRTLTQWTMRKYVKDSRSR